MSPYAHIVLAATSGGRGGSTGSRGGYRGSSGGFGGSGGGYGGGGMSSLTIFFLFALVACVIGLIVWAVRRAND